MKTVFLRTCRIIVLALLALAFVVACLTSSDLLDHLPFCSPHLYSCTLIVILPWMVFALCALLPIAMVATPSNLFREYCHRIPRRQAIMAIASGAVLLLMMCPPMSFSWMRTNGLTRFILPVLINVTMGSVLIGLAALLPGSGRPSESSEPGNLQVFGAGPPLISGGAVIKTISALISLAYGYAVSTNHYGTSPSIMSVLPLMAGVFCQFAFLLSFAPRLIPPLFWPSAHHLLGNIVVLAVVASMVIIPRLFLYVGDVMLFPVYNDSTAFLLLVEGQAIFAIAAFSSAARRKDNAGHTGHSAFVVFGICFPLWYIPAWTTFDLLGWGNVIQTTESWQRFSSITGAFALAVFAFSVARGVALSVAKRRETPIQEIAK